MSKIENFPAEAISVLVTQEQLSITEYSSHVESNSIGAIVTFAGNVRNHDRGREVLSLRYEIHPSAQEVMERVVRQVLEGQNVLRVSLAHRYGEIPIGECAFIVAVSAAHREAAFAACSELVDQVKAQIPIWKYQVFTDGSDEWVNCA